MKEKCKMKEFHANKFITLKFITPFTFIYIAGKRFKQCKRIIIEFKNNSAKIFNDVESIDEAIEDYKHFFINSEAYEEKNGELRLKEESSRTRLITPIDEFWAHCSNLQVWVENNYKTNLIHSNLAFSLLKELVKVGDLKAKEVFLEQILKRLSNGYKPVIDYLFEEGYLNSLNSENLLLNLIEMKEAECLLELEEKLDIEFKYVPEMSRGLKGVWYPRIRKIRKFTTENKHVVGINLYKCELKEIPKQTLKLNRLKVLKLNYNAIMYFADNLNDLKTLEKLSIQNNMVKEIPINIEVLTKLRSLNLNGNEIMKLPESIGNLRCLESLLLKNNRIDELPESIGNLKCLKKLKISCNPLNKLPESLGEIESLEYLELKNTNISTFPNSIKKLKNLITIDLSNTRIEESISQLQKLESLREIFLTCGQKKNLTKEIKTDFKKKNIIII